MQRSELLLWRVREEALRAAFDLLRIGLALIHYNLSKMAAKYLYFISVLLLLLGCVRAESEYKVVKETKLATSIQLLLEYTGKDNYYILPKSPIIKHLNFTLKILSFD